MFGRVFALKVPGCLAEYMPERIYSGSTRASTRAHTLMYGHNNQVGTRVLRVLYTLPGTMSSGVYTLEVPGCLSTQVHTRRYDHNNQVGSRMLRILYTLLCLVGYILWRYPGTHPSMATTVRLSTRVPRVYAMLIVVR